MKTVRKACLLKILMQTYHISSHVGCGSRKSDGSQYISLSTSLDLVFSKSIYPKLTEVNVRDVPKSSKIIDLNDENIRNTHLKSPFASNCARKDCEVLLACKRKYVPCTPLIRRGKDNKFIKLRVSER